MYFRPETNTIFQTQSEVRSAFPDVSMPELLNDQIILAFGVFPVFQTQQPEYNQITQGVRELTPESIDGSWQQVWEVYDLDPEQIAANEAIARQSNKDEAMQLLTDTDWTHMPDVNLVNKDEFTAYRASIRSIALNPPVVVESWPVKPDEVWS